MSNEYPVDVDATLPTPLPIASPSSVGFSADRLNRMDPPCRPRLMPAIMPH
jgi:hypothetical protein